MLDSRVPPEVILGYVVFMTSPSFPKFCLKKLSPVACEAPAPFLQHYFSEKAESCRGLAEAKVQATTSLPLHGMAGFKGCRPVPPTPEVFIMGPEGVLR